MSDTTLIISILSIVLGFILAFITIAQYKIANYPFLIVHTESKPCEITKLGSLHKEYLDILISNSGTGIAKNIEWVVLPKCIPEDFFNTVAACNFNPTKLWDFTKMKGYIHALAPLSYQKPMNIKGYFPKKEEANNTEFFEVYLKYNKLFALLNLNKPFFCKFTFDENGILIGKPCSIKSELYDEALKESKKFALSLGIIINENRIQS